MTRIVSTSLLIAAGIAISACNVTTSSVTHFDNSNDDEQHVVIASASLNTASTPTYSSSTGTGSDGSSSTGGGGSRSAASTSPSGNDRGGSDQGGGTSNAGHSDETGGTGQADDTNNDPNASAEAASRTTQNNAGELDKDARPTNPVNGSLDPRAGNTHNGVPDKDGAAAAAAQAAAAAASTAGGPSKDGPGSTASSDQNAGNSQQDKDGPGNTASSDQNADNSQQEKDGPAAAEANTDASDKPEVVDHFENAAGSVTTERVPTSDGGKD